MEIGASTSGNLHQIPRLTPPSNRLENDDRIVQATPVNRQHLFLIAIRFGQFLVHETFEFGPRHSLSSPPNGITARQHGACPQLHLAAGVGPYCALVSTSARRASVCPMKLRSPWCVGWRAAASRRRSDTGTKSGAPTMRSPIW